MLASMHPPLIPARVTAKTMNESYQQKCRTQAPGIKKIKKYVFKEAE
jgi:hypothetical protein